MTRQEPAHDEALKAAETEACSMLGVPLDRAFEMLDEVQLSGTAAEAELRMLRFVLDE